MWLFAANWTIISDHLSSHLCSINKDIDGEEETALEEDGDDKETWASLSLVEEVDSVRIVCGVKDLEGQRAEGIKEVPERE